MLQTIQSRDITTNFAHIANQAIHGTTFVVSRPRNLNLVVMSEAQHHHLLSLINNTCLDSKLDKGIQEIEAGQGVEIPFKDLGIDL